MEIDINSRRERIAGRSKINTRTELEHITELLTIERWRLSNLQVK